MIINSLQVLWKVDGLLAKDPETPLRRLDEKHYECTNEQPRP